MTTRMPKSKESKTVRNIKEMCATILFVVCLIVPAGIAGTLESYYSNTAIVKEIRGEEIILEDTTGNLWGFDADGYNVGDKVEVTFDSKHTDNKREDDEIVKVKKIKEKS